MPEALKIKIKTKANEYLHPETEADVVLRGESTVDADLTAVETKLTGVTEASDIINTITTVKVNDAALTPDSNKAVNIEIPLKGITVDGTAITPDSTTKVAAITLPAYTIAEATATSGYLKTYQLYKDNVAISGSKIDIPKDFLVKSATMGICETAGVPETTPALAVGDPYLDFVINTKDGSGTDSHIYINVASLVDTYTAGTGIDVTGNVISNTGVVAVATGSTNGTISVTVGDNEATDVSVAGLGTAAYEATTAFAAASHDHVGSEVTLTGYEKASAASAVAATDTANQAIGKLEKALDGKAAATHDHVGSEVTLTGYTKASAAAAVAATDTANQAIGKLEKTLDGKQATIDSSNKLDADLVDDSTATNKFVTAAEKTAIANAAVDSTVVHLAGTETVTGAKTFSAAAAFSAGLTSGETINAGDNTTKVPTTAWVQNELSDFLTYELLDESSSN